MRHHPVLHRRVACFFLHRYQLPTSLSATDEEFERKRLFVTAATASLRLPCPALPSPTLLLETVAKAYTTIGIHKHRTLSLSLDCRRYCSLVKTWRHISQRWTLHRIKAGRQQTNCQWQRMLYCLLELMDRQFLPRYLWMMRLGIPHCDTTCTFHASRYTPTCRDIRSHETPSRARHWRYLLLSLSHTRTHTHMYARAC